MRDDTDMRAVLDYLLSTDDHPYAGAFRAMAKLTVEAHGRIDGIGERFEDMREVVSRLDKLTWVPAAGSPGLLERAEKAESLLEQARAQRDAYEQALVSVVESIKDIL